MTLLISNGSSLVSPQKIAATTDAAGDEVQHVRFAGGAGPANQSGNITSAQPTAGSEVAGGAFPAVANLVDYSSVGNVTVALVGTSLTASNTVVFEASPDAGTNWFSMTGQDESTNTPARDIVFGTTIARVFSFSLFGFNRFRVRRSVGGTGTIGVVISPGTFPLEPVSASVVAPIPPGAQRVTIYGEALAYTGTTEAILSLVKNVDGTNTAAGANNVTPTTGRTLVLQQFNATYVTPGTAPSAAVTERFRGRYGIGANPTITSPIQAMNLRFPIPATANTFGTMQRIFPNGGFVIPSGSILGISAHGSAAAPTNPPTFDVEITGFEF